MNPVNPSCTVDELVVQLKDAGTKAIVTQEKFLTTVQKAAKEVGICKDCIILMGDERDGTTGNKHFSSIKKTPGCMRLRRARIDPQKDLAFLVYSSGTTGYPKGCMLSHENVIADALMLRSGEGGNLTWNGGQDGQGDRTLAFLPFFHIYGKFHLTPSC